MKYILILIPLFIIGCSEKARESAWFQFNLGEKSKEVSANNNYGMKVDSGAVQVKVSPEVKTDIKILPENNSPLINVESQKNEFVLYKGGKDVKSLRTYRKYQNGKIVTEEIEKSEPVDKKDTSGSALPAWISAILLFLGLSGLGIKKLWELIRGILKK